MVRMALAVQLLARDAQAKLALIVAQCLSIHLCVCVCVSVRDSLSRAYVRSIARREPPRLPACVCVCLHSLYFEYDFVINLEAYVQTNSLWL